MGKLLKEGLLNQLELNLGDSHFEFASAAVHSI